MDWYFAICAAVLGAVLGSFINALSFRYGTGLSVMRGRSQCMACGHALAARDLVPVLSYAFLLGKCRHCGAKISLQYPLVELAAALTALLFFFEYGISVAFFFSLIVSMTLLFALIYDLRHMLLPAEALWALGVLGFGALFISCDGTCHLAAPSWWALASGPLVASPLLLISAVSRGRWMGWGDGLLMISLGWFLGLWEGFSSLLIAFWVGAIVGLLLIVYSRTRQSEKGITMASELPFAPFLILGAAAAHFLHVDIFTTLGLH